MSILSLMHARCPQQYKKITSICSVKAESDHYIFLSDIMIASSFDFIFVFNDVDSSGQEQITAKDKLPRH